MACFSGLPEAAALVKLSIHLAALQAVQGAVASRLSPKPDDSAICHMSAAGGEVDQYRYARPNPSQGYLSRDAQP